MKKAVIDDIIEKNPNIKNVEQKLEAMKPGAYCIHRSWGFGQIQRYDEDNNKLVIDFKDRSGHSMDPAFCLDKLEVLSPNHILSRYQTDSATIDDILKKQPTDIIVEILSQNSNHSAAASEIERIVEIMMGEVRARKWWTATKKLLVKDPRIAVPNKKTDPYTLREDPLSAEQEILEDFYMTKNHKKKILLAEKLHQLSSKIEDIEHDLPQILESLTSAIKEAKLLTQAERLHGCWVRNDLARHLHANPEDLEPTSGSLLEGSENLSELAESLPSQYHKRFLDLVTRVFLEDWENICLQLLRNSSGKFTSECVNFLMERECSESVCYSFKKWLDEQTLKGPVLYWIIKNRHVKRYIPLIKELMTPRLLVATLQAIDNEALLATSTKRIALADLVTEDGDLIRDLMSDAHKETAQDMAQMLILSQGFEDLSKKSVLARFIKLFPSVQTLVSGESNKEPEQLIVSAVSLEGRKKEYETLINQKIPENKAAIATAREHGDLRENSEYKMARQDQDTLLARKSQLELEMGRARVTDFKDAPKDIVAVGSVVDLVEGSTGKNHTFAILGAWDSDPSKNVLSYKTPLGQGLLGKKAGDTVSIKTGHSQEKWTIQAIRRWVDIAK